ncbi:MAG TPA: hypothetical protein VM659_12670 [Dongiaceae bacterium]|nr:hypothetical protein [Dongiaceae bacterium]
MNRFPGRDSRIWTASSRRGTAFARLKHYHYLSKSCRDFDIERRLIRSDCRGRKYLLLVAAITVNLTRKSLNVMPVNPLITWWHDGEMAEQTVPSRIIGAGGSPGGSGTAIDHGC